MKKGFSNLREHISDVDRYFLFKDGQTVTISELSDSVLRPSNALNNENDVDGFNSPAIHAEPLGSASLNVSSFTVGKRARHKLFQNDGLLIDNDEEIFIDNEYIHKNLVHEGRGSSIELGDCPIPLTDEHGTVGCLNIVGQAAPIFFPEWDITFPIDVLTDQNYASRLGLTFWNGQSEDTCTKRAENARSKAIGTVEYKDTVYNDTYHACRNLDGLNFDTLKLTFPNATFDEYTEVNDGARNVFSAICGCTESESSQDMAWKANNCGWEIILNEEDVRVPDPSLDVFDSANYSDESWLDQWQESFVASKFSEGQQTTEDLLDFKSF